jgi:serine protease Do
MKNINTKKLLFSLFLLIVVLTTTFTSCVTFTKPGDTTTPAAITETTTTPAAVNTVNQTWTPVTGNQVTGQLSNIADVVALVKPAVVAITTEVVSYDFFNRPYTQEGAGSGWIIDPDGIIVTNNHVVEGAKTITVTTDSGDSYTADMNSIFTDSFNDLAIIKINAAGLPSLTTGDASKLRLGDWVIAIGNALGQGTRVTEGIVSRKDVSLSVDQGQTLYNLIETSAAINPGNSGGPLVNLSGEVIGITSAKVSSVGVEGMGYAISINTAKPIIQDLVNKGFVTRPFLGVSLYTVDALAIREFNLNVDKGVLLLDVSAGSPAADAGLKTGDVVVNIGGTDVSDVEEFTKVLHSAAIGQPLEIKYWRDDAEATATVTPIESPRS